LDGYVRVFVNGGDGALDFRAPEFVKRDTTNLAVPTGRSSPVVADLDADGRKDILAGNTEGQLLFYRNAGRDDAPEFFASEYVSSGGSVVDLPGLARSRPFVCDWNDDGAPDILVGGGDGRVRLYLGSCLRCPADADPPDARRMAGLGAPYPNPFNPSISIPFSLGAPGRARIAVFDVRGRLVSVLADRTFPAGEHEIVWRGRNGAGGSMPSGVYIARLEAAGTAVSRKIVLAR